MNTLHFFVSQPWIERLGWVLVHFLWEGALIAAAYALARPWRSRTASANARYSIACGALVAMMAAPVLTYPFMRGSAAAPVPRVTAGSLVSSAPVLPAH